MRPPFPSLHLARLRHGQRGIALILVLSLVVILSVLVLAFFSRAILDRQISDSSAGWTEADLFAQGSLNTILGDLKNEIIAGSNSTVTGSNYPNPIASAALPNGGTLYIPNTPATVIPAVSLPSSITSGTAPWVIPNASNLVKISQGSQTFYPNSSPYVGALSSRASSTGTGTSSLNGRSISLARWNKALLLPKSNASSTTNLTPLNTAFVDPDWILVARDGSNPGAGGTTVSFGSTGSTANNTVATNTKYVVGRYAYVIYDEGGLLDANAVGLPAPTGAAPRFSTGAQALNYKNSEAFVDLTQLTAATSSTDSTTSLLSTTSINNLIGWRNYVSAAVSGNFPALTPNWTSYYNNILNNLNPGFITGYLTPAVSASGTAAVANNQTDRMFSSRHQLIGFLVASDPTNVANTQSALQYLTHFSRDLEQPLIIPNPSRPKITAAGYTGSGAPTATGGNTEYGNDTDSPTDSAPKYVNPNFLNILGSDNNPVVIKRFPLSRLALLTSAATCAKGSGAIYAYFGLYRTDATQPWVYDHGAGGGIYSLGEVAKLSPQRDPDFLEMLKAAMVEGSLGKGGYPRASATNIITEEMILDTNVDFQVMQVAANLLDQSKADNYPTRITPSSNVTGSSIGSLAEVFSGDEDMPYFYRLRRRPVQTLNSTTTPSGVLLFVPEVWNPHMQNTNDGTLSGPTSFQIWMETPSGLLDASTQWANGDSKVSTLATLSQTASTFIFGTEAPSSTYYRQPTVLAQPGLPYSSVNGPTLTDINGLSLLGVQVGAIYYQYSSESPATPKSWDSDDTNGIIVHLDYQSSAGAWIEYQEIYFGESGILGSYEPYSSYAAPSWGPWAYQALYDPRTSRFGVPGYNGLQNFASVGGNFYLYETMQAGATAKYSLGSYNPTTPTFVATPGPINGGLPQQNLYSSGNYFTDPDGVVRPGMGSFATGTTGLPMATITTTSSGTAASSAETSRPLILHRPFRSVAEMGYAFTGTPWRNIDFSNPQSGSAALLEAFCLNESDRADGMVAGRVNLNTRQLPVLKALFNGAYVDEFGSPSALSSTVPNSPPYLLAKTLLSRTESASVSTGLGPLESRTDLVGRMIVPVTAPPAGPIYVGFSADSQNSGMDVSSALTSSNISNITRWRESAIRGLADVGTGRTWSLMIDVIAQTGRYPQTAQTAADFVVEGERRYWLHVAIDRYTGKIIDRQLEPVSE